MVYNIYITYMRTGFELLKRFGLLSTHAQASRVDNINVIIMRLYPARRHLRPPPSHLVYMMSSLEVAFQNRLRLTVDFFRES
jgi:hypothetical protein